jgi:hypothetical protein
LFAGKLVLIVAIHSLGVDALIGITRQTLNRVPHNQHKMMIHKACAVTEPPNYTRLSRKSSNGRTI